MAPHLADRITPADHLRQAHEQALARVRARRGPRRWTLEPPEGWEVTPDLGDLVRERVRLHGIERAC